MNYPVWQLGFPGGLLIAAIAILHVFVSHFAVGGGAYLVLTEHRARRRGQDWLLAYTRRHAKFFALLTVVFGAVSGVGIWFTIALVSPETTSSLIHTFVWGWAIEWVFFFVEIAAVLIYAYQWETLDARTHLTVGWIYFAAAWASMMVINGILTYMLTPGTWIATRNFWDGLLNPTYLPSLLVRSAMAVALAGMFGLVSALAVAPEHKPLVVRWAGWWLAAGLALVVPFTLWDYGRFPLFAHEYLAGLIPFLHQVFIAGAACAGTALLLTAIFALWKPLRMNGAVVGLILASGLMVMGAGEYLREVSRKPFAINGYIYANDLRVAAVESINTAGVARTSPWLAPLASDPRRYGRALFATQCGACHMLHGYRGIDRYIRGWDEAFAAEMLPHLHLLRGSMPPFAGDEQDRAALAVYLASIAPATPAPADDYAAGQQVFQRRCAPCHTLDGARRPLDFAGFDPGSLDSVLSGLSDLNPNMPRFTGSDTERRVLAVYLVRASRK